MEKLQGFYGPNAGYVLELYERFLLDPASVDAATRQIFEQWAREGGPGLATAVSAEEGASSSALDVERVAHITQHARTIRSRGLLAAQLDPLGDPPPGDPNLNLAAHGIGSADLALVPASVVGGPIALRSSTTTEALDALRMVYCGTTGYDYAHVQDARERAWLRDAVESGRFTQPLDDDAALQLLGRLTEVEAFEQYLQRTYTGQKRFSIEGTDMLIPMLDAVIKSAALAGTRDVVLGMAHRGRLNVLAHVLGKPFAKIFGEFQHRSQGSVPSEQFANYGWTGDVKYHLGARKTLQEGGSVRAHITLSPNPSHLEFVNPVILGMTRALQETRDRPGEPLQDTTMALAILIHGDAAFPGEGIVAESLNISRLAGYRIGGAMHIIANNQLGFTTDPLEARSTVFASDLAKGFEIPIVHVNADDPEACLAAARMAYAYHQHFHKDFLIDLVGYRRWGHNEADEPAYTQPLMYEKIRTHPSVRALWAGTLAERGILPAGRADALLEQGVRALQAIQAEDEALALEENGVGVHDLEVQTAVPAGAIERFNVALLERPDGFAVHGKLERLLGQRREALTVENGIEWAHAEALALASLLVDGTPIRMIGQDTERGTFSQRHLVLHDTATGARYIPLRNLAEARASFAIYNSPLSESAALGFEYGFSDVAGDTLVIWEAQFGDFANAGQVIIDQFISSARAKWRERPWLVLLLPHGYEGMGPEHSSGRVERFLQLAGGDNLRVANCTTAAQYFHLLRRQVKLSTLDPRPLVVMTPKSLLRDRLACSSLADLTAGGFQPVLDDRAAADRREVVTRLVLCSGRVYVDLIRSPGYQHAERVAIIRLEQLYPFPGHELAEVIAAYPYVRELIWLQEEPRNMGAWSYMAPRLRDLVGREPSIDYIGRPDRASPAEGSPVLHAAAQSRLVSEAFSSLQGPPARVRGVKQHAG